jgi:hypothetical protein
MKEILLALKSDAPQKREKESEKKIPCLAFIKTFFAASCFKFVFDLFPYKYSTSLS